MDFDQWQFNINKLETLKSNETRELVRQMFNDMIHYYNEAHQASTAEGLSTNPMYKASRMMFNTLLANGYLISERERKLGEVLDNETTSKPE